MNKIKKGDTVIVITGKDRGKKGTVVSVNFRKNQVLVEGINLVKKHVKPDPNIEEKGGIVPKPMPLHISNVKNFDPNSKKGSKVGIRVLKDGQRKRYYKSSDQLIDVK